MADVVAPDAAAAAAQLDRLLSLISAGNLCVHNLERVPHGYWRLYLVIS